MVEQELALLTKLRADGADRSYELYGEGERLSDMDYDDIVDVARHIAERSINEAIHRWNETHE